MSLNRAISNKQNLLSLENLFPRIKLQKTAKKGPGEVGSFQHFLSSFGCLWYFTRMEKSQKACRVRIQLQGQKYESLSTGKEIVLDVALRLGIDY
jgi:hypothetical protein